MKCDACSGRGFVANALQPDLWPVKCKQCNGRGRLSWRWLGRLFGVDRRAVRNVHDGRATPETCARVLAAAEVRGGL